MEKLEKINVGESLIIKKDETELINYAEKSPTKFKIVGISETENVVVRLDETKASLKRIVFEGCHACGYFDPIILTRVDLNNVRAYVTQHNKKHGEKVRVRKTKDGGCELFRNVYEIGMIDPEQNETILDEFVQFLGDRTHE